MLAVGMCRVCEGRSRALARGGGAGGEAERSPIEQSLMSPASCPANGDKISRRRRIPLRQRATGAVDGYRRPGS